MEEKKRTQMKYIKGNYKEKIEKIKMKKYRERRDLVVRRKDSDAGDDQ